MIVLTPPSPNLHLTVTNQCIFKINDLPGAPRGSVLEPRTTDLAPKGPHNLRSKETTTNWGAIREWSWQVIDNSTDFRFFCELQSAELVHMTPAACSPRALDRPGQMLRSDAPLALRSLSRSLLPPGEELISSDLEWNWQDN